ncbi:MAG: exodeoxyribonuclease VII large subunit [Pseudobdellovibrionaceae bacterium]
MNENNLAIAKESTETAVLSVEELNRQIRQLIEGELGLVWVQGEISNFKAHTSGHFYFSLKDSKSQVSAVMFRGFNSRLKFKPVDGLEVVVRGRVSVYEPRGSYQIVCEMMEPVGAGALQKAFEQLKEKLKGEGLFDSSRKRPLPAMPKHIAIVTSPTGAAIRDMINVLNRRNRSVPVTLVPTLVQGEGAAAHICEALRKATMLENVDVIIIGRGGGSIEDLWAFNDERLARAIAACPVPVISAVGHEIDFTIADFVADLRAPTPSAAAELVVKNTADLCHKLEGMEKMLRMAMSKFLRLESQKLQTLTARLVDPKRRLQDLILRNDELLARLQQAFAKFLETRRLELKVATESMPTPQKLLGEKRSEIGMLQLKMNNHMTCLVDKQKMDLNRFMALLESLSPLKVVERGYSVVRKSDKLVKAVSQLNIGDDVNVRLAKGEFIATVKEIK